MTTNKIAGLINIAAVALTGVVLFSTGGNANAANQVTAQVDISDQRMVVSVDGRPAFEWKVSTAGKGYVTPTGAWRPTRTHKIWYSKKYDNAPMPHSVFFTGGYAIHATDAVKRLGTPASHGCVRLAPEHASDFYQLVQVFGAANTKIVIVE